MNIDIHVEHSGFVKRASKKDERGVLFVAEGNEMPFSIARVYALIAVPDSAVRGGHAHKKTDQVLFMLRGSLTLDLDDGARTQTLRLSEKDEGLRLGPLLWHTMRDFTPDCIALVLASLPYDEADYIRDHDTFKAYARTV